MDEPRRPTIDETAPVLQAAIAALGLALSGCRAGMSAVHDGNGRRKHRLSDTCWHELECSIGDFTRHSKMAGSYPEQVIIRIKQIAMENAPTLEPDSPLRDAILRLCLQAYYGAADWPNSDGVT
jgi:hypothetical protein